MRAFWIKLLASIGGGKAFLFLVSASFFNLFGGIIISHMLSRMLAPHELGDFYFLVNLVTFLGIFSSFGVFYSGSRLLLSATSKDSISCYHGAGMLVLIGCSVLALIPYLVIYYFDLGVVKGSVRSIYFFAVPGLVSVLLYMYFETVLPSTERVTLLAQSRIIPKLILLSVYYCLYSFYSIVDGPGVLLLLNFVVPMICYLILFSFLSPKLASVSLFLRDYLKENRKYGFHVYVGSVFTAGGTALLGVAISFFGADNTEVAYFALATSLCSPLSILPAAYVSSKFRDIARDKKINSKYIWIVCALTSAAALALCLLSSYVVEIVWGNTYEGINSFVYILSCAYVVYAIADLLSKYLSAHGYGRELRNASILVGITLVFSAVILTKTFGGAGVAIARVFSGVVYLLVMSIFYKKVTSAI